MILNNSTIKANAVRGNGGNIDMVTDFYLPSTDSVVSAASEFGLQGTVSIQSQYSNIAGSIGVLPGNVLNVSDRLWDECNQSAHAAEISTFVLQGRGSLPIAPDASWMPHVQASSCGEGLEKSNTEK